MEGTAALYLRNAMNTIPQAVRPNTVGIFIGKS